LTRHGRATSERLIELSRRHIADQQFRIERQRQLIDGLEFSKLRPSGSYDFIGGTLRGLETMPVMAASNCSSVTGLDRTGVCLKESGNAARS
jgi:hypothetical protein